MDSEPVTRDLVPTNVYRCCKCGAVLFRRDMVMMHKPFEHRISADKTKRDIIRAHGCLSIFLESCPPWIKNQDLVESKIYCPNCQYRLGSLKWQGEQCSCGTWVSPAIQFPMSKVDMKSMLLPKRRKEEESTVIPAATESQ